jgi:hypothetical protein
MNLFRTLNVWPVLVVATACNQLATASPSREFFDGFEEAGLSSLTREEQP